MSYIERNLLQDEQVLFRTKKHKIIFAYPVFWTIFAVIATNYMQNQQLLQHIIWAPWIVAFITWFYSLLEYITSEFVVTNKRVMMREGFFIRHTNEMRISSISQVNVEQSLLGQMLNYGIVSINAFGAYDSFSVISRPFLFQKAVNEQLDKLVR